MDMKRTGWALYDRTTFVEVLPQDDIKEHLLGDECWCNPKVESIPDGLPDVMIVHNAADKRELTEGAVVA